MKFKGKKLNKKVIISLACIGVLILSVLTSGFGFFSNEHGKFVKVGDMHYARSGHRAVLLQDGRVLILGGTQDANAEIYTPQTKKFKLIEKYGDKNGSTLTLLNNGQVLLTGLAEHAELFDPKTEKFIPTGKMNYPRYKHTATLLKDGRVLIVGGEALTSLKGKVLLKERIFYEYSEIYDPKIGKFELGSKINNKRTYHSAILLDNSNVLIVGGENYAERILISELYDTKNNKFIEIGDTKNIKLTSDLIKLQNGKVLIFNAGQKFEIYDPSSRNFDFFMPDTVVERSFNPVLLKDGNILFIAGSKKERWYYVGSNETEILNPYKKELVKGPNLHNKRGRPTATLLEDGTVLITGGLNTQTEKGLKSAEIFIPSNKIKE